MVRVKKHDETRREYMTLAMELKKFREEGKEEGRETTNQLVIMNLVGMHMPVDSIAKAVGQSTQYVQQVIERAQGTSMGQ